MRSNKTNILAGIFLMVLISGIVSAETCSIQASCNPDNTVMKLSAATNAHGEVWNGANYNQYVCCDFTGTHTCDTPGNRVLKLSAATNAHAEIPTGTSYSVEVCFSNLECISDTSCGGDHPIEMVSLSSTTNAHIGGFNDYSTKICCEMPYECTQNSDCDSGEACINNTCAGKNTYWADSITGEYIDSINVEVGVTTVSLVLENTGALEGEEVSFEIIENDPILDDDITTLIGIADINRSAHVNWTITQADLDETEEGDYEEFYFNAEDASNSNYLNMSVMGEVICETVSLCMHYETELECGFDSCSVAAASVEGGEENCGIIDYNPITECNETENCECVWNGTLGVCQPNSETTIIECESGDPPTPFAVGKCSYEENTDDDCEDRFLNYSWMGNWEWNENNVFGKEVKNDDDYIEIIANELYRYDPLDEFGVRISEKCISGENIISCPSQVKLPFFGFYGFIVTSIMISLIYVLLGLKKRE